MYHKSQRMQAEAAKQWAQTEETIGDFLSKDIESIPKITPKNVPGWQVFQDGTWIGADPAMMGQIFTVDFESKEVLPDYWLPTICCVYDGQWWYGTPQSEGAQTFAFPNNRIIIGHNSASYDRRYISSAYDLQDCSYYLDTMQLNTIMHGLSDGDSSPIRAMYAKFKKMRDKGMAIPNWFEVGCTGGLKDLTLKHLGFQWAKKVDKTIRDKYIENCTSVSAHTLFEYCCTDVEVTQRLATVLFRKARLRYISSPVTWLGMGEINRSRYYTQNFSEFIEKSESLCAREITFLTKTRDDLIEKTAPTTQPFFDWTKYVRGQYKGLEKWRANLTTECVFEKREEVLLLDLHWKGQPIHTKTSGRKFIWMDSACKPLPHPSGSPDQNLGSPLVKDFRVYALDGTLTSGSVDQETLIAIFDSCFAVSQWLAYRSRYKKMYTGKDPNTGQTLCVADLNGTGTLSRRATSPIWVLLPKPNDLKIGSDVMTYIGTPKGWKMVSADFVSQESRIAASQLTDARLGAHCSTPWSESVMRGDKALGTDPHSTTAQATGLKRNDAKTLNFATQYGAGLTKATSIVRTALGCSEELAQDTAIKFIEWLKGKEGVAVKTYETLRLLSGSPHVRSYLLNVLCPDTLNIAHLFDASAFITTRNNWHIQTAGQDELHTLIFFVKTLAKASGVPCVFACAVHDRAGFYFKDEDTERGAEILDQAYKMLMEVSYQSAAKFWDKLDPLPNGAARTPLEPLPNWTSFEKVYVADNLMEKK